MVTIMNGAHIHLILNHVPVLGTLFGLLLLAYALFRKNKDLMKVSLVIFVLAGLFAGAVYLSGEQAEEIVEHLPGVSESIIEAHEDAGLYALVSAIVLGVVSLFGLWRFFRKPLPTGFATTALLLALATSGVMAWTATLGGQINHPEIRSDQATVQIDDGEEPPGTYETENDD